MDDEENITTTRAADAAERRVLGAMLTSTAALWRVLDLLTPSQFHTPKHAVLYEAIAAVAREKHEVDTVIVGDYLLAHGQTMNVPLEYLHELAGGVITATNVEYYAGIVARHATMRVASFANQRLAQGLAEGRDTVALIEEVRAILDGLDQAQHADPIRIGEELVDLIDSMDKPPTFYPTPWNNLNAYMHGLMPGAVVVVAARPGSGKSIVGLQIANELCKHGTAIVFSLEMSKAQMLRRLLAMRSGVSLTKLTKHTLTSEDWLLLAPARREIQDLPLYIDDRSNITVTQMESYARRVARTEKLSVIVIDYLQFIPSHGSPKARWEQVGEITRALHILAKELNVPIVLLSQLNRESEKNRRLPSLADLRESGSIEQDADAVLMMQRRTDPNGDPLDELDMVIAKNRHGQVGRLEFDWLGKFSRIEEMKWGWQPTLDAAAAAAGAD